MAEIRIRNMSESLHEKIKIRAIQEKKNMNDFLLTFLQANIDNKICKCGDKK